MGFFNDWADELKAEDKRKEREELEREMDNYGLSDEEKDHVRNGDYDPWDFEYPEDGDDMDEDDYYGEDN